MYYSLAGLCLLSLLGKALSYCDSTTQGPIDICFSIDQSGSIDDVEYAEMVSFLTQVIDATTSSTTKDFPTPGTGSVVVFSDAAEEVVNQSPSGQDCINAVDPRLQSGRTALTDGINLCVTSLIASLSGLPKVLIVMTDGVNNQDSDITPAEVAARAGDAGIFMIAVAIGDGTDPTALRAYLPSVSPSGVLYYASDFASGLNKLVTDVITEVNDADEDGVCNDADVCPGFDDNIDTDGDGTPDGCDACPTDPEIQSTSDAKYKECGCNGDDDDDGVCNADDKCPGYDDNIDSDGDGVPDGCDVCPNDAAITSAENESYKKCGCVGDDDNDGVCNDEDKCPGFDDNIDMDGDGVPDGCDNCDSVYNPDQKDGNKNGVGDACEIGMCEYSHDSVDINAKCVSNCGGGRWSNCKEVCEMFGVPFVSNVQCNNAGINLTSSPPCPYNDKCDRTKVCCMCRPFVNHYPDMKPHIRGPNHRGQSQHSHHLDDCDCEDLIESSA